LPDLKPDSEEVDVFSTIGVQPLNGISVFVVELWGNPDDDVGVDAGGVRD